MQGLKPLTVIVTMMSTSETAARLCLQVHRQRPATLWSHNTRKIWGKIRAYLDRQAHCVCERGNSIGGDFRCGCTFIAGHFKASHHACMAHHGWLMAHYLAGASLFSIVRLWEILWFDQNSDAECGRLKMLPSPSRIEERRPLWGETDVGRDV